tara:strand:- start:345 stop:470 length:126 start_codon:yes stop_codon:yes gene_type:complete
MSAQPARLAQITPGDVEVYCENFESDAAKLETERRQAAPLR